jgi:hypothetical protein
MSLRIKYSRTLIRRLSRGFGKKSSYQGSLLTEGRNIKVVLANWRVINWGGISRNHL